jgi:hypothetical protein
LTKRIVLIAIMRTSIRAMMLVLATFAIIISVESIVSPSAEGVPDDDVSNKKQHKSRRWPTAVEPSILRTGPSTVTDFYSKTNGKRFQNKDTNCRNDIGHIVQLTDLPVVQWAAAQPGAYAAAAAGDRGTVSVAALRSAAARQHAASLQAQSNAVATRALGGTERVTAYYTVSA